ncbi:MAG: hypothetical protein HN909_09170 [Phycisphaerales bacterium]|nr:hypothetical protein [Phycisphaerales bacterium]
MPDDRLLNQFVNDRRGEDTNETYRAQKPDPNTTRPRIRPIAQLHGELMYDQMAVTLGTEANAKALFKEISGTDGLLNQNEWNEAMSNVRFSWDPDGVTPILVPHALGGSEFWDEAVGAQRHLPGNRFNGETLTFDNFWGYLQLRKARLVAKIDKTGNLQFDKNGNLRLDEDEMAAVNKWLSADLYDLLAQERTNPLRPAQPLGIINGLLLCALLCWFFRHRRAEGHVFALLLLLYPMTRFMLESVRHELHDNLLVGRWTHNQVSSVIMTAAGLALWIGLSWYQRHCDAAEEKSA